MRAKRVFQVLTLGVCQLVVTAALANRQDGVTGNFVISANPAEIEQALRKQTPDRTDFSYGASRPFLFWQIMENTNNLCSMVPLIRAALFVGVSVEASTYFAHVDLPLKSAIVERVMLDESGVNPTHRATPLC